MPALEDLRIFSVRVGLREDFGPESDVDVLVSFDPDIPWSLFDWIDMIEELQSILGREVGLKDETSTYSNY